MIQTATFIFGASQKKKKTTFPNFHLKSCVGWIVLPLNNFTVAAVKLSCIYTSKNARSSKSLPVKLHADIQ